MSHHMILLQRGRLAAEDPTIPEQIGAAVVDAVTPRLLEVMPQVAQAFVDEAAPRMQQKLLEMQPQLNELAIQSAQAVLSDPAIRDTVKQAVAESTEKTKAEFRSGLIKLGAVILGGVLLIEIAEPYLPGRK